MCVRACVRVKVSKSTNQTRTHKNTTHKTKKHKTHAQLADVYGDAPRGARWLSVSSVKNLKPGMWVRVTMSDPGSGE